MFIFMINKLAFGFPLVSLSKGHVSASVDP